MAELVLELSGVVVGNLCVHGIDLELTGEGGIKDGARRPELEKNSSISLLGARILGILEGIWRGPRGEDFGATARPDSLHSSRDSDEVVAAALRARSEAPVGTMAFPSLQWMK
uniref:Uncharacterized protein n=2 Tax=Oryza sativa subsp. japonica TaxID=39947 RepID=Q2R612_ORYSJ|nr:hypothetical protein LOC_Os11g22650 [Oryza sativa Japonica Group]ABA92978.1 hypothetical protein LOC_Os11g22650 [Oryza sativa Japonica Group]